MTRLSMKRNTPEYYKIYKQVRSQITKGILEYGQKLPSKRDLADKTGTSVTTVEHAYGLLIEEGYIEARKRSGYFVAFKREEFFLAGGVPESEVKVSSSPPPEETVSTTASGYPTGLENQIPFPLSVLAKTMREIIKDRTEKLLEKSPNWGLVELREAIQSYLARTRGIEVQIGQIIIGSGSEYLYGLLAQVFGKEKTFAIENPSYSRIELVYLSHGVRLEKLPIGEDGIKSESLVSSNADILHISPYRSFPSGVRASASKRYEYLQWAKKEGRYIVEDDYESEFSVLTKNEETLFAVSHAHNVIYLNSFTKTISPSLRAAYMILPKSLIPLFSEKIGFYSCTVPIFEQLLLSRLISNGDFERHINKVRRDKRKKLTSILR